MGHTLRNVPFTKRIQAGNGQGRPNVEVESKDQKLRSRDRVNMSVAAVKFLVGLDHGQVWSLKSVTGNQ
ncbi:hypothetical protein VULLAG_LOCUS14861 [Vulpes lagopus]